MGSQKPDNLNSNAPKTSSVPYGKVELSLNNVLLPEEKLSHTPSREDGLDQETETSLRILGCELIQTAGILLRLPQVAMATGQVLFQRFYYSKSFVRQPMETTAMACVCLASKIEEAPRTIRDVINVFHHIKQVNAQKPITAVILDVAYISLKTQVIKAERRVLKELGFCVHVKHPHKIIVMYLRMLGLQTNSDLMQLSWNYMNDSLRSDVFMRYDPESIACACIFLSARMLGVCLPRQPAWFSLFRISTESVVDISVRILRLYNRPRENADDLEKKVLLLRKVYEDGRGARRGGAASTGANSPAGATESAIATPPGEATLPSRHRDRRDSPSPTRSPSKHKRNKKHKSRSRSRSNDRRSKKHKRKSLSPSPSPTRPTNHKHSREKTRYRSRSRSPIGRSSSYEKYYSSSDKKSKSKSINNSSLLSTYDSYDRVRSSRH